MFHAFDASIPPLSPYPNTTAVLGYIGGRTPHIWTLEEWQRFAHMRQAPIWVVDLSQDPKLCGASAARSAYHLGWRPYAMKRRAIVLDMETLVDSAWVNGFARAVYDNGYKTWIYGSAGNVFDDPAHGGYWVALWDRVDDLPPGHDVIGHQYDHDISWGGSVVDLDVFDAHTWDHFGRGPRHLV